MDVRQIYVTVDEVLEAIGDPVGKNVYRYVKSASDAIYRKIGYGFLPLIETRTFQGNDRDELIVMDALSVSAISTIDDDGTTDETLESDDWELVPYQGLWQNGPKTRIHRKDGGSFSASLRVQVTGVWGLFDDSAVIAGESITQTDSATTLTVADGSKLSAGMVVEIGDEYELVTGYGSPTAATSLLAEDVDASQTTMLVDDGDEFNEGEVILVSTEKMRITLISGNKLVVVRGWEKTTIEAHDDDSAIQVYRTFAVERGINGSTAAEHSDASVSRVLVPDSVNYLAVQVAALMWQKARTGFAGQSGGGYGGGTFYLNEFPHQVDDILNSFPMVAF